MKEAFRFRKIIKNIILFGFAADLPGNVRPAEEMRVNFPAQSIVEQDISDIVHKIRNVKAVFRPADLDKNFASSDAYFIAFEIDEGSASPPPPLEKDFDGEKHNCDGDEQKKDNQKPDDRVSRVLPKSSEKDKAENAEDR